MSLTEKSIRWLIVASIANSIAINIHTLQLLFMGLSK